MDTLLLFLEEKVLCEGDDDAVFACLKRVMEHDIPDARRSAAARTTKKVEPVSGETNDGGDALEGLDDYPNRDVIELAAEGAEFKGRLYELLEQADPELYELVYAIFEENALKPRVIAEVLSTTTDDIQNRKKRLRTFLAKHDIMKAFAARSSRSALGATPTCVRNATAIIASSLSMLLLTVPGSDGRPFGYP